MLVVPAAAPLTGFALVTAWLTGPLSPLFPFGYEPIVMLMARVEGPLLVTGVSVGTMLLVEAAGLRLYGGVLSLDALGGFRRHRWVRSLRDLFGRSPFLAIWLVSWTPVPFWTVRVFAALSRYPLRRYLAAVFLGRFPKILLFAWLGVAWSVSGWLLAGAVAVSLVVGLVGWGVRRGRAARRAPEAAGDHADGPGRHPDEPRRDPDGRSS